MSSVGFRRSNGRIPACEPCKTRKVGCDHLQPVCTRCTSRGQQRDCVYVDDENPRPSKRRQTTDNLSPVSSITVVTPDKTHTSNSDTATSTSVGYLGFTSFSAVFEEAGILHSDGSYTLPASDNTEIDSSIGQSMRPGTREKCLTLLQRIPERTRAAYLFRKRAGPLEGWIKFIAEHLMESLYETFGQYLGRSRKPSQLELLANQICTNTAAPFSDDEDDARKWMAQFSGQNMRWESIGILICFWDEDSTLSKADVDGWVSLDRENLDLCMQLCKEISRGNSLMLYLTYRLMMAESLFSGDASLATWRLHGEAVSLLTFLGFHADAPNAEYKPTMSSEIKRKLCAVVYIFNVTCVSFTGRPLLINSNYILTPLPLGLEDQDLALDQDSLWEKAGQLDSQGWNQEGDLCCTTVIRALALLASIREEVTHIALGKSSASMAAFTLTSIKHRQLVTVSNFPKSLQHNIDDLSNSRLDITTLYTRLVLRLEHLQNLFFIERLLIRHGQEDQGDLLAVSIEMVTHTLHFWTHLDRLLAVRRDCEWLVMSYAAPAGGILCRELLVPRPDIISRSGTSRSKIVQKLSLLVGYLGWVDPSGPNGKLCQTCKTVIEHVLDQAINALDIDRTSSLDASQHRFDFPAELNFNFDLLDTFDWLRSEPS